MKTRVGPKYFSNISAGKTTKDLVKTLEEESKLAKDWFKKINIFVNPDNFQTIVHCAKNEVFH